MFRPAALARVKGDVGILEQLIRVTAILRPDSDADADADTDGAAAEVEGRLQRLDHLLRRGGGSLKEIGFSQHDGKFVAAQSRNGVALVNDRRQPLGDGSKEAVSRRMAEAVINRFEAVEVAGEDGEDVPASLGIVHFPAEPVPEQRAVGQAGQHIMRGQMFELMFRMLAFRDVDMGADHAQRASGCVACHHLAAR